MGTLGAVRFSPHFFFVRRGFALPSPTLFFAHGEPVAVRHLQLLSVYFFSVYKRSTPWSWKARPSNFWRRQRHLSTRNPKTNSFCRVALDPNMWSLRLIMSRPRAHPRPRSCHFGKSAPPLPRALCVVWFPSPAKWRRARASGGGACIAYPLPSSNGPGPTANHIPTRTAILPGIHLNPSDFRS